MKNDEKSMKKHNEKRRKTTKIHQKQKIRSSKNIDFPIKYSLPKNGTTIARNATKAMTTQRSWAIGNTAESDWYVGLNCPVSR